MGGSCVAWRQVTCPCSGKSTICFVHSSHLNLVSAIGVSIPDTQLTHSILFQVCDSNQGNQDQIVYDVHQVGLLVQSYRCRLFYTHHICQYVWERPLNVLECHKNVKKYVDEYGGEQLIGSYILVNTEDDSLFVIRHSVWKNEDDKILDITPFDDNRPFNIFIDVDIMMKEMCYI